MKGRGRISPYSNYEELNSFRNLLENMDTELNSFRNLLENMDTYISTI